MKEFLEAFVLKWSYLQILIILVTVGYLIFSNRTKIVHEIKNNKKIFYLLVIIILVGSILRFSNLNEFVHVYNNDSFEYIMESLGILVHNRFIMVCDPPSYAVLISIIQSLFGMTYYSQSFLSSLFGTLSILLLFIFTQILIKNYNVSLISALLLTFSPLHLGASSSGYPTSTSIFFSLLFLILFINAVKYNKFIWYFAAAVTLSFTGLLLYVETVLALFAGIYILVMKNFKFLFNIKLIACFFIALIFMTPFIILQNISETKCASIMDYEAEDNFLCKFAKSYCKLFNPYYILHNNHKQQSFVNDVNGHLPSYLSFLFLGYGRHYENLNLNYWHKKYIFSSFDFVFLVQLLLIIFSMIYLLRSKIRKPIIFLLLMMLAYILIFSMYMETSHYLILPIIVYGIIPLVSTSLFYFCKNKIGPRRRKFVMILLIILVISPFFYGKVYQHIDDKTYLSRGDLNFIPWSEICPKSYDEYKGLCYFLLNHYINKYNIKEYHAIEE